MKKEHIWNLVIALVVVGGLAKWWYSRQSASAYNAYIAQVRPILELQDQLLNAISRSSNVQIAKETPMWIKRSESHKTKLEQIKPKDPEMLEMHRYWLKRTDHITNGLKSLQQYLKTPEVRWMTRYKVSMRKAKLALDQYIKLRDAHFKKHGIRRLEK